MNFLAGVRVVEAGGGAAVSVAGRLLADLGAAVVKVRPCADSRPEPWALALDERKRILDPRLLRSVIESGGIHLLLVGDPDAGVTILEEAIVGKSMTVAYVDSAGMDDLLLQAAAGVCAGIGEPERTPLKLPLDQSAHQGGLALTLAACAALLSGRPQRLLVSILDVWAAFFMGPDVANARFGRSKTRRGGHRSIGVPWPRTILPCKDGYFAVQCATREHWQRFLALVGCPELEHDPLFADRVKANDEYGELADAMVAEWFQGRTKEELLRAFLAAKVPGAPVFTVADLTRQAHLLGRNAFHAVPSELGEIVAVNPPCELQDGASGSRSLALAPECTSPLGGLRVLDFGWVWAGAVPGHILADLGAEVIKVETATRLDYMRQGRPIVGTARDPEQNPMFQAVNRGKLSVTIDMGKAEGAAILRRLAAVSDVVIENFAPGVLERHGLAWGDLRELNPGLIMCSLSAAGATGPLRNIRTYATMIAGLCGLDAMVGYAGERVLGSQSSYADPNASLHATLAVLAALYRRARGGAGCWIDLSQWQAGLRTVDGALAQWSLDGRVPTPSGLDCADRIVHGCFATAQPDGWVAISVRTLSEWEALRAALGDPDTLPADPSQAEGSQIAEALAREVQRLRACDLAERLQGLAIAEPVATADRLADDPRIRDGALFEDVEHPILGAVPVYRLPWLVDGRRIPIRRRAPLLGEHTDGVLEGILRLTGERIAALREAGVLI